MPFPRGSSLCRIVTRRPISSLSHLRAIRAKDAPVDIHPEVEEALVHNKPVVALETALVTHGLPYPQSLEVPLGLESIVRSTGAVPATIGIIGGRVKVGLERHELDHLADRTASKPAKVSRRDIAAAIAMQADGGQSERCDTPWASEQTLTTSEFRNNLQCHLGLCGFSWHQSVSNISPVGLLSD